MSGCLNGSRNDNVMTDDLLVGPDGRWIQLKRTALCGENLKGIVVNNLIVAVESLPSWNIPLIIFLDTDFQLQIKVLYTSFRTSKNYDIHVD